MTQLNIGRPEPTEYATYYGRYISLVDGDDLLEVLNHQPSKMQLALSNLSESDAGYRYAPGKWSIREVVGHIIDTERVFGYRAFCIARGEKVSLPGFDEKEYAQNSGHDATPLAELLEEFESVRRSNLLLFRHLLPQAWESMGVASENPVSTRALAYILAGHVIHHLTVLEERYAVKPSA